MSSLTFLSTYILNKELFSFNDTSVIILVFSCLFILIIKNSSSFVTSQMDITRETLFSSLTSTFKSQENIIRKASNENITILTLLAFTSFFFESLFINFAGVQETV